MDFTEGNKCFSFNDSSWQVRKYDNENVYPKRIAKLPCTKGIDFIGIHGSNLYLIEVKDCSKQTQQQLENADLPIKVAQNVRDTIAGIVGAYQTSGEEIWGVFAKKLIAKDTIKIVIWLEYEVPAKKKSLGKVRASVYTNVYKQQLSWLTSKVFVVNKNTNTNPNPIVPDLTVKNKYHP